MKILLTLLLLIPSLGWGKVIISNPFDGSDDLQNKKILCSLNYNNGLDGELNPNTITDFVNLDIHNKMTSFELEEEYKNKYFIPAPEWDLFIFGIEFMKDNTVAVFETNSRKVINKSTIYDLMDEAYLVPEFEKTFAYYYAFEDKIFIQLDSNSVGSKVIHFIDRYTLNFSSPGGQKTKDCEVVEYSIGKIFNETKIKSENYFEEIKNKIKSELSKDRKI